MSASEVEQKIDQEDVENKPVVPVFKEPLPIVKVNVEREQEIQLKNKYPQLNKAGAPSNFLQKRLSKGQKFFDSGDYNMAKAQNKKQMPLGQKLLIPSVDHCDVTGDEIPTPETVPQRKASLIPSSKSLGLS